MFRQINQGALQGLMDEQIRQIQKAGQNASLVLSFIVRVIWIVLDRVVMPVLSQYESRSFFIGFWQFLSSEQLQFLTLRSLVLNHKVYNLYFVALLANLPPFFYAYYKVGNAMPCPRIQQLVIRGAMLALFGLTFLIAYLAYKNFFLATGYAVMLPAWLGVASLVMQVRMHTRGAQTFDPLYHYPLLGLVGGFAQFCLLYGMKTLRFSDALVLTLVIDHVSAAIVGSCYVSEERKDFHYRFVKEYILLLALLYYYLNGEELPTSEQGSSGISYTSAVYMFALARFLIVGRAMWVKKRIAAVNGKSEVKFPSAESSTALFVPRGTTVVSGFDTVAPRKHRFDKFPQPVLWQMDALWDTGLLDDLMHGTGPAGTIMVYVLTDFIYTMPILSIMCWQLEFDTLAFGFLPPAFGVVAGVPIGTMSNRVTELEKQAKDAYLADQMSGGDVSASGEYPMAEVWKAVGYLVLYCAIRFMYPFTVSKTCFDRGCSPPDWPTRFLYLSSVYFMYDVVVLFAGADARDNRFPRFQLVLVIAIFCAVALLRSNYWKVFKKKYYLLATRYLHYVQPSCVRTTAKELLVDFANNVSVEDYGNLLLDCVITHGQNLTDIARASGYKVWDPKPSATAAWKLAGSLVTRGIHAQKKKAGAELNVKAQVIQWLSDTLYQCASDAVDSATGHGKRYMLCAAHANISAKERVFKRLRQMVHNSQTKKSLIRDGTLSRAPLVLATSRGIIRPVDTVVSMDDIKNLEKLKLRNAIARDLFEKTLATKYVCIPKNKTDEHESNYMELPVEVNTSTVKGLPMGGGVGGRGDDDSSLPSKQASVNLGPATSTEYTSTTLEKAEESKEDDTDVLAANDMMWGHIFALAHEELHGREKAKQQTESSSGSSSDGGGVVAGGAGGNTGQGAPGEEGGPASDEIDLVALQQMVANDARTSASDWSSLYGGRGMLTMGYKCIEEGKVPSAKAVVRGFGNGNEGQLGTAFRYRGETRPMDIERFHGKDVVQLQTGIAHSFSLLAGSGNVLGFGSNRSQCLGLRSEVGEAQEPYLLRGTREEHVVQVATAKTGTHTLCLCNNGGVYVFGTSAVGALGLEPDSIDPQHQGVAKFHERNRGLDGSKSHHVYHSSRPVLLRMSRTIPMKQVAVGARFSCMIDDYGVLYVFGDNGRGQLGIENMSLDTGNVHATRRENLKQTTFDAQNLLERSMRAPGALVGGSAGAMGKLLGGSPGGKRAAASSSHGENEMHSKDFNNSDLMRVGTKMLPKIVTQPMALPEKRKWKQVVCGDEHVIGVAEGGEFFGWGANSAGQLGIGKSTDQFRPQQITRLSGEKHVMTACGSQHSIVITENPKFCKNSRVAVMGSNAFGQLGLGRSDPGRSWPTWMTLNDEFGGYIGSGINHKGKVDQPGYYFLSGVE
eukprot:CAMPEP_0179000930 /NCGR_PEP_ID=MMETSP0795-20121207/11001_1 /TAXON_ID=88552 /ORGANISM="Amoebophrya sp., Strain Ameob2" /LENGTH=1404 /DNA_ID=CAMNT_0020694093 /DNA_START=293 /DNA_END=4507 /DNA_ORIENTATION=-